MPNQPDAYFNHRIEKAGSLPEHTELLRFIRECQLENPDCTVLLRAELSLMLKMDLKERVIYRLFSVFPRYHNESWLWNLLARAFAVSDPEVSTGCQAKAVLLGMQGPRHIPGLTAAYQALLHTASREDLRDFASLTDDLFSSIKN